MKIKYLGTGAAEGWPALFCRCENCERAGRAGGKNIRTRSQMLIDRTLLMDFGPDTFYHAMEYKLDMAEITTTLLTHSHSDHFYPTELILRAYPYAHNTDKNPLMLYGSQKCRAAFERTLAVEDDSENMARCVAFTAIRAFQGFTVPGYEVFPMKASHDPAEECLIYSILDRDGKCMLYGNDTGYFNEETWKSLEGAHFDLVSLDCTMGRGPECSGHMDLSAVFRTKERMLSMGCANTDTVFVITHFSHNGGLLHEELEERAGKHNIIAAYDGMEIVL